MNVTFHPHPATPLVMQPLEAELAAIAEQSAIRPQFNVVSIADFLKAQSATVTLPDTCADFSVPAERLAQIAAVERRLLEHGAAMVRVGEILGQKPGESLVGAAERCARERDSAAIHALDARARVRAAEDAIALHSGRHVEALRLLDEVDGDLVEAVRRRVNGERSAWAAWSHAKAALCDVMTERNHARAEADLLRERLSKTLADSEAADRQQEAAMPVDDMGRGYRQRCAARHERREAAIAKVSGRTPAPEPPLVAGGEAGVLAGWVTLAAVGAVVALLAAGIAGWLS